MNIFAVITLAILLMVLTHFQNWLCRKLTEDFTTNDSEGDVGILVFANIMYLVAVFFIVKYIIIWGQPLFI